MLSIVNSHFEDQNPFRPMYKQIGLLLPPRRLDPQDQPRLFSPFFVAFPVDGLRPEKSPICYEFERIS